MFVIILVLEGRLKYIIKENLKYSSLNKVEFYAFLGLGC